MFEEPAENKLLKLLKEGAMREAQEEEGGERQETDNRLLRILRDKRKKSAFADETPTEPPPRGPSAERREAAHGGRGAANAGGRGDTAATRGRAEAGAVPQTAGGAARGRADAEAAVRGPAEAARAETAAGRGPAARPSDAGGRKEAEPAARRDSGPRPDARRILEAAREDASTTRAPLPTPAEPPEGATGDEATALRQRAQAGDEAAAALRQMVQAAAEDGGEPPRTKPSGPTVPKPGAAVPVGPSLHGSGPAPKSPTAAPPAPGQSPAGASGEAAGPRKHPPAKGAPAAPPAPRTPVSPRARIVEPYAAPEGGLALTALLKADQIQFLLKMAASGQGSMIRMILVAQCLMGGQGEWGLAGLLQEYARTLTGVLNKLMIQERLKKEVDLGAIKEPDLDALLEEIRDLLEAEELSATLEDAVAPPEGLLLGVTLTKEDVAFLRKLATPKGDQTLVGHLLFTQALMAHEIVGYSPWPEGPAAARIREDFKNAVQNFRDLQKTLLNQVLVSARLKKKTTWGADAAAKHEAALAELARTLKACLPGAQG